MDFMDWIKFVPLHYLLSSFIVTGILGGAWYWYSTPGPSVDFPLVLSLWLIVAFIHYVIYKYRSRNDQEGSNNE